MSIEAWIGIAALVAAVLGSVATVVATIIANRPREEAFAIANIALNHTLSWAMTAATIAGGIFFWQGREGTGAIFFAANAVVFSYFFLKAEGPPGRPAIFMLVIYWMMASTIALAGLISKISNNLGHLIAVLSKAA
jgi:hypothetical protein